MLSVGVRELKARLSSYLREVRSGEVVLVTDRGRVVAELRKPGTAAEGGQVDQRMRRLAEQGRLRLAANPADRSWLKPTGIRLPRAYVKALLDAEREE